GGFFIWVNQEIFWDYLNDVAVVRPYRARNFSPYVLTPQTERALRPGNAFRECAKDCPEMMVIPSGVFLMGSAADEMGRYGNESPQHSVVIGQPLAISKINLTFDDWDA